MKFLYLIIDFATIIIPLLFSFHPKLRFYKTWKAFFPAVILTGIFFIVWDIYFTALGVWGFNLRYLTGITIFNLPIEEILFFFCIPYSCVFTFYCLDLFIKYKFSVLQEKILSLSLIAFLIITGFVYNEKVYTSVTFLSLSILLLSNRYVLRITWLSKFYIIYAILLIPFCLVNGILTGTGLEQPIVWYDEKEIIGIRIGTIPFEDIFYGMALILMNLTIYKYLVNKAFRRQSLKETGYTDLFYEENIANL